MGTHSRDDGGWGLGGKEGMERKGQTVNTAAKRGCCRLGHQVSGRCLGRGAGKADTQVWT